MHGQGVLVGALCTAYLVAVLFFLRFWRLSRDGTFLGFAIAFALFAVGDVTIAFQAERLQDDSYMYLFRLAGLLMLAATIIRKNVRQ